MTKIFLNGFFCLSAIAMSLSLSAARQELGMTMPVDGGARMVPTQGLSGQFGAWLLCGKNDATKKAVTALLAWCIAYTVYQAAKNIGTTLWSLWHDRNLSPEAKRDIERVVLLMKQQECNAQVAASGNEQSTRGTRSGVQPGAAHSDGVTTQSISQKEGGNTPPSFLSKENVAQLLEQLIAQYGNNTHPVADKPVADKNSTVQQHARVGECVCGECHKHRR